MIGVLVNTFTVLLGSSIGLLFKKLISKKICDAVMVAIGACTIYVGINGLVGDNVLITIVSMVIGVIFGTIINIDGLINSFGDFIKNKINNSTAAFTQGFVSGSLLFCVGAMTITGSIASGINGDNSIIYAKSLLDLVSSAMLTSALGFGVMVSAVFVFVFQSFLVLISSFVAPLLSDALVNEITCVGSVIIILLGINILGIGKFKIADFLPAILICPIIYYLFVFLSSSF
ncbi:MAG: DUF554 domain-containing protein [Acutalibacteraceae bacterium]|nr:DUF554 domain-containing protein [Acutalibacteraceae bacterium]